MMNPTDIKIEDVWVASGGINSLFVVQKTKDSGAVVYNVVVAGLGFEEGQRVTLYLARDCADAVEKLNVFARLLGYEQRACPLVKGVAP